MKYRFTLARKTDKLSLLISEWDGTGLPPFDGEILTSQMIEDFLPRNSFLQYVREQLPNSEETTEFSWSFSDVLCTELITKLNMLASLNRYGCTASDYTGLVGKTPLVKLNSLTADCCATVLVKLESMEPNSVKDRTVHSIIKQAIKRGEINDQTEVIEASSGNVAFALSAILQVMLKKKPKIFMSKMHGKTKARAVQVSGVPVVMTAASGGTASAKKASVKYAAGKKNVFQVNQHGNPDNPRAHRLTTGPELYHQCHVLTGQPPAEFVTGLGSGGTGVGVAMFRDDIGAGFKVIGVEPEEASLLTEGDFHAHRFSGLAPGFITDIVKADRHRLDGIETISWKEGFAVCRRLLIEEGYLVGASTGASVGVALRRAKLPENAGKVIVTMAHDRGDRYLEIEDLYVPPPGATAEDLER